MDDGTVVNAVLAGGAFIIQVIAIVFVARVSRDYQLTLKGVDGLQASVNAIASRERRNKLLAEQLYLLASLQARFSQRGMTLLLNLMEEKGKVPPKNMRVSLDQLADQIETASHEVGIFSNSSEVRNKALRSLAFGKSGPDTVALLDDLIELDLECAEDYKKYRRQLVSGLWAGHYNSSSWTGRAN